MTPIPRDLYHLPGGQFVITKQGATHHRQKYVTASGPFGSYWPSRMLSVGQVSIDKCQWLENPLPRSLKVKIIAYKSI